MCTFFLVGRLFRVGWARRGAHDRTLLIPITLAVVGIALLTSLKFEREIIWNPDTKLQISWRIGSVYSVAALLFAAGFVNGVRGVIFGGLGWVFVKFGAPYLVFGPFWEGGLDASDTLKRFSLGAANLDWRPTTHLIDISSQVAPAWKFGGIDPIFAVFGWRVAASLRGPRRLNGLEEAGRLPMLTISAVHMVMFYVALAFLTYVTIRFALAVLDTLPVR